MAGSIKRPEGKTYAQASKKNLKSMLDEWSNLLDDRQIENGYDVSRINAFKAVLAKPALDWNDEQYGALLDDLQANILKHHNKRHAEYLLLTFREGTAGEVRHWLADFAAQLTTAKHQLLNGHKPHETVTGLYLTYAGYRFLGIPEAVIPPGMAFRAGVNQRTRLPRDFEAGLSGDPAVHAIVFYAYNQDPGGNSLLLGRIGNKLEDLNARWYWQPGRRQNPLPAEYHFKEGMGNPHFFPGTPPTKKRTAIKPSDVSPLELVLAKDTGGNGSMSYGSYGAFLKLQINAGALKALEDEIAGKTQNFPFKFSRELVRAYVIGRFTDGTPLSLSEKRTGQATNDFDYSEIIRRKQNPGVQDDRLGARCPFHAHIRKANPRHPDTKDIRIVRRGVFYAHNDQEKGLLFHSFQRNLESQFEYILNNWMLNPYSYYSDDNGKPVSVNSGADILFSRANDKYEIPAGWNDLREKRTGQAATIVVPDQIVAFRGGLYFFAPSVSFFTKLVPPQAPPPKLDEPGKRFVKRPAFLPGTERRFRVPERGDTYPAFREKSEVIWLK